jgi:UDP-N-acetylglucosamine 2-epimerase (hydrolysing)
MNPNYLPTLKEVKEYYEIPFNEFAIAMYHPVTTEYESIKKYSTTFVDALLKSNKNYIVIFPNNDLGTEEILEVYKKLETHPRFKLFPSLRFEYFLKLLQESSFIMGNSSAGIREAPYYKIPTINIGSRQNNRHTGSSIVNISHHEDEILSAIENCSQIKFEGIDISEFGDGNSNTLFLNLLKNDAIWKVNCQKQFQDL